mgnify:CR=1 FL=1
MSDIRVLEEKILRIEKELSRLHRAQNGFFIDGPKNMIGQETQINGILTVSGVARANDPVASTDLVTLNYLNGQFLRYDDEKTYITAVKLSASKPPTWVAYKGSQVLAFSDQAIAGNEEYIYFPIQLPHGWNTESSLYAHVHWVGETAVEDEQVRWRLTYSWSDIGSVFPAETTVYSDDRVSDVQDTHQVTGFSAISGAGHTGLSSILLCSLSRNSSAPTDNYAGYSAYLIDVDFHIQVDRIGSLNPDSG